MQERIATYTLNESSLADTEVSVADPYFASPIDVQEVAEVANGYRECMEEAVRYLTQVENYPYDHPAVLALEQHLASSYRGTLLRHVLSGASV